MTTLIEAPLCPGCFTDKGNANPCPHCGFDETVARSPNALAPRALLNDQFILGRVLGKPGGFGITYLGFDQHLQTTVAIKEYLPRDLATRATDGSTVVPHSSEEGELFRYGLEQFLTEARTLAQLNHPNIVRVRQFFEANGSAYLVMDYYQGLSLAEHLERQQDGRMSEQQAIALMQPILDGLRAVHAKGFLHRDIKPQNIYLARTDSGGVNPILLDFGAARQAMGERSRSLSVVVSDGYAPFEQYHRKGKQGPWTDVYSAAAVLYRMLTGITPPEATERIHDDEFEPASRFGVSQPLSDALSHALAVAPDSRPQSVEAFKLSLQHQAPTQTAPSPKATREASLSPGSALPEQSANAPEIIGATDTITGVDVPGSRMSGELNKTRKYQFLAFAIFILSCVAILFAIQPSQLDQAVDAYAEEDYQKALALFRPLAGERNAEALSFLADMYFDGLGVQKDVEKAVRLSREAVAAGLEEEIGQLGWYLIVAGDFEEGRKFSWIARKQEPEKPAWAINLGHTYLLQGDHDNARSYYRQAIPLIPDEETLLYMLEDFDLFAEKEWEVEASNAERDWLKLTWYSKAAEEGDAEAQNRVGLMYDEGRGVEADDAVAVAWYRRAAMQGLPIAQFNLAQMYDHGEGIAADDDQAMHWYKESMKRFREASSQGDAHAAYMVGTMYYEGLGVVKDEGEALVWYTKAAEAGDADAQNALGVMYDEGIGVELDDAMAARWYRKAAENDLPVAQYNLGLMYQAGEGVRKDAEEALKWYKRAAEADYPGAQDALRDLMSTSNPGFGAEADSAVADIEPPAPGSPLTPGDAASEQALGLDRDGRLRVQVWLNALGYETGTPDGVFGPRTRSAIAAYHRDQAEGESRYLSAALHQRLKDQATAALEAQIQHDTAAKMLSIAGGCFDMGSPVAEKGRDDDERQHRVCVDDFRLSKHEVTVGEFRSFIAATGYQTDAERNAGGEIGCIAYDQKDEQEPHDWRAWANWNNASKYHRTRDDDPVACVSWNDAQAYVNWLNSNTGGGYRLPTEAEWEYATRARTSSARFWGEEAREACRYANVADRTPLPDGYEWTERHACSDRRAFVAPVGSYVANPWGLYDMLGNLWEWTCSEYSAAYGGAESKCVGINASGARSLRGSSWANSPEQVRSAYRNAYDPPYRQSTAGFRLARD